MAERGAPVRVLQINSGNRIFGGISSMLYNVYTHIDRSKVQFDFLFPYFSTYDACEAEIRRLGGQVFQLGISGSSIKRKASLYGEVRRFLKAHPYTIVHINSGNLYFDLPVARAARDAGVNNVIVHSHNTDNPDSSALKARVRDVLKPMLAGQCTAMYACSAAAGQFMFPRASAKGEVAVIHNGLDIGRFDYNPALRAETRARLGLEKRHVVGHAGMFNAQKNQGYLIRAFARLAEQDSAAALVLLGEGDSVAAAKERVRALGLEDRVRFEGLQRDIERYYQAFDAFAFPSVWEGLGMVLVEAQISGLSCVASKRVPREADVTGHVTFLDIDEKSLDHWAEALRQAMDAPRHSCARQAAAAGYDIDAVAADLVERYLAMAHAN